MMSTSAVPEGIDTEHCIDPSRAVSEARRRHNSQADENDLFDDLDADDWKENVEVTDVQEREWVLTEVEYYTVSEEREEFEFPLSKDIPENSPSDPFETDEITIYDSVSTGACSVCDGEGVSACETCGGDGEWTAQIPTAEVGRSTWTANVSTGRRWTTAPSVVGGVRGTVTGI